MARIELFQGGVAREAPSVTPFRAPDFGPGIAPGVEKLGQAVGETAQKINEIQDLHARIEANTHAIAYNELQTNIGLRVKSALGDQAEAAAEQGLTDLHTQTQNLLAKMSPRARHILEPQIAERMSNAQLEWLTHGFEQKRQAFDTSSQAANDKDLEAAGHTDTEQAAKPFLDSIAERNHQRASFFGLGSDWETGENLKAVSGYHKGRAQTIGANSAYDAVQYAIHNRASMSDDDFNAVVHSYREEALHERAVSMYYGSPLGNEPTVTAAPPGTTDEPPPTKRADPAAVFNGLEVSNEGSALVTDSNGHPVRYGINQGYNPDVDVARLTHAGAQKLFTERVWNKSGADKLPPALAVVHADTFFLNEKEAGKILRQSGGDVDKYMELRDSFLASLHASNPAKYPDYSSRNKRVADFAAAVGGSGQAFGFHGKVGPDTAMAPIISEVMARTDIPLALKTAIVDIAREDRNAQREDRTIKQEDARDALVAQATSLGDSFTSIKQLPPEALANASPTVIASVTRLAKTNRYKKDDQALLPEVNYAEFADTKTFMSKDYVPELMRKGASPALIKHVQERQGEIMRQQMSAKPAVTADGTLWSMAKTAFKAAGIAVDAKTPSGKKAAAQQQMQAVGFLQNLATTWEQQHPGERPTPEIMRQWVGTALLNAGGKHLFQASDADIFNSLRADIRGTLIRGLRRHGDNSQGPQLVAHVANAYRQLRALYGTGPIQFRPDDSVNAPPLQGVQTGRGMPEMPDTGIGMSEDDYADESDAEDQ